MKSWRRVRQLRHYFGPRLTHFAAPCYPARAVGCYLSVLGADAHRMLIGTFDSMLCPIYRFRHLRRKQLAPKGRKCVRVPALGTPLQVSPAAVFRRWFDKWAVVSAFPQNSRIMKVASGSTLSYLEEHSQSPGAGRQRWDWSQGGTGWRRTCMVSLGWTPPTTVAQLPGCRQSTPLT